jgi:hypothetical protein
MLLCRFWFRRTIYHWHAVGLGVWTQTRARPWERLISHALLDRVDLAVVLSKFNQADAEIFRPRRVAVVHNGIPDPCPDFEQNIRPLREAADAVLRTGKERAPEIRRRECDR